MSVQRPIPHEEKASASRETVVPVQVINMRPFSNTLKMTFIFQLAKTGQCSDTAPMNLQGAVMKDSYLDITGIPHWAVLPNLELFAERRLSLSREKADLADTGRCPSRQRSPGRDRDVPDVDGSLRCADRLSRAQRRSGRTPTE